MPTHRHTRRCTRERVVVMGWLLLVRPCAEKNLRLRSEGCVPAKKEGQRESKRERERERERENKNKEGTCSLFGCILGLVAFSWWPLAGPRRPSPLFLPGPGLASTCWKTSISSALSADSEDSEWTDSLSLSLSLSLSFSPCFFCFSEEPGFIVES